MRREGLRQGVQRPKRWYAEGRRWEGQLAEQDVWKRRRVQKCPGWHGYQDRLDGSSSSEEDGDI